jgi:hypothetical protein
MATPNMGAMIPLLRSDGMSSGDVDRVFGTFNVTQFHDAREADAGAREADGGG